MNVEQSIEPGRKTFFSFRWRFFIRFTFSFPGKTQFDQLLSRLAAQKLWTDSWSFRKKCCKAIFKLVFIRHHCFSIIDFSFHYFSVYRQQLLHSQFHSSISAFFTIDIMQFINSFSIPFKLLLFGTPRCGCKLEQSNISEEVCCGFVHKWSKCGTNSQQVLRS